jgi:hypothetical protein
MVSAPKGGGSNDVESPRRGPYRVRFDLNAADVPFGTHVVRLTGVPGSCRVDNGAERTISLGEQRRAAVVRFDVRCD